MKPEEKLCADIAPKEQIECQRIVKAILNSTDAKAIDKAIRLLAKATGQDADTLTDKILKYCPVCGEEGVHEHG